MLSWASCQISKIAGCACARNAGNVFPATDWLAIPRAWRTCRDACRDRQPAVSFEVGGGENVPGIPGTCATRNFTYLIRGPWKETFVAIPTRLWKSFKPVFIFTVDATRLVFVVITKSMSVSSSDLKDVASLTIFFKQLISMVSSSHLDLVSHIILIFRSPMIKANDIFSLSVKCKMSLIYSQPCVLCLKCGLHIYENNNFWRLIMISVTSDSTGSDTLASISWRLHLAMSDQM